MLHQSQLISADVLLTPQPITESDYSSPELMRAKIRTYQHKLSQLYFMDQFSGKLVRRQQKQNEYLKQQLKQLNSSLTHVLEKNVGKKETKKEPENAQDVTRKELDNSMKQIANYKKDIHKLKMKLEAALPARIETLENELRAKDELIDELKGKVRTLEKMDKVYQTSDISKIQKELNTKVSMLTQELAFHRKKFVDLQKQEKVVSDKPTAHNRTASQNKIHARQAKVQKAHHNIIPDQSSEIQKLKQSIDVLEYSKVSLGKKYKSQLQSLQGKNFKLQQQVQTLKNQLSNKQKQTNIVLSKFNQLKRRATMYTLQPIKRHSIDAQMPSALISQKRRQFKGVISTINKEFNGVLKRFDDTEALSIENSYRISKVSFRWKDDKIVMMSVEYTLEDGSTTTRECFGRPSEDHYNRIDLELAGGEYINSIEGYHNNKQIEYLKISTSRRQTIHVGSDKNYAKSKKFQFDIATNEKPVAFLGSILVENSGVDILVSLGLQLRKKEVAGKVNYNRHTRDLSLKTLERKAPISQTEEATPIPTNDKNVE